MLSKYIHRVSKQCIVKLTNYKTRHEDGEGGRQALPYRSAERGLYSREPWGKSEGEIRDGFRNM